MVRYPHTLNLLETLESVQDENGNWVGSDTNWQVVGECREEPNSSSRTIILADGKAFQYSSMIYMPVGTYDFGTESKINVTDENGNVRLTGSIARISFDRKNVRIWV